MSGWVELGQPYATFWALSLREIDLISRAIIQSETAKIQANRRLNQEMASLIAYAYHDPKNIPDYSKYKPQKEPAEVAPLVATEQLRAVFIGLSSGTQKG